MKLVINYDLLEYINTLNNADSKFILVKYRTKKWMKRELPIFFVLDTIVLLGNPYRIIRILLEQYGIFLYFLILGNNHYRTLFKNELESKKNDLVALSCLLQENLNVSTNVELLLQSELYHKEKGIVLNEKRMLDLISKKYINIPCYSYSGDIKTVSLLQEHVIGSKEYVLSLGSPKKEFKLAYSGI